VIGVFLGIKYSCEQMMKVGGGSIICTASVAGLRSGAGGIDYSASKAAVINMVQVSANQLGGTNIRVNAICPVTPPSFLLSCGDAAHSHTPPYSLIGIDRDWNDPAHVRHGPLQRIHWKGGPAQPAQEGRGPGGDFHGRPLPGLL